MDIRKLQRAIVDGLEDVKAQNIVVFNTEHLSPLFERVIIASGTSNRQTKSLAASVRDAVKAVGLPAPRVEGEANGEWIIVDCGAAVVHVMQPTFRDYYHLEELWGDKPVRVKLHGGETGLVKASEPDGAPRARAVRARTAGVSGATPRPAAKKSATSKRAPARQDGPAPKRRSSADRESGSARPGRAASPARSAPARSRSAQAVSKPTAKRAVGTSRSASTSRSAVAKSGAKAAPRGVTRLVGVKSAGGKKAAAPAKSARRKTPAKA